ncbi:hypothetical protein KR009_009571, partial [Drosophila setifemur]
IGSFLFDMWQLVVQLLILTNDSSWLNSTLARIHRDKPFETIIMVSHSQRVYQDIPISWPVLKFDEKMDFYVRGSFNNEMLALVWQTGNTDLDSELWETLDRIFLNMRGVRLLLVRNWEDEPSDEVASMAQQLQFINLAVIGRENRIYRLQPYAPKLWMEVKPNNGHIFEKIRNFHGRHILTLPDQYPPRSIGYRNPKTGDLEMTGFVYKFLHEFTKIYNFTFRWQRPIEPGLRITLFLLRNMTLNGTISMPISLCGFERSNEFGVFSDIFDMDKWMVLVPCAHEIPTADVYLVVCGKRFLFVLVFFYCIFSILDTCFGSLLLHKSVDWSNLFLNERMISGIMGQSFNLKAGNTVSSRVTNATLFFLGMVLSSLYAAHLKTLLTKHPTAHQISNFEELRDSPVSVYFGEAERFYLDTLKEDRPISAIRSKITYVSTPELQRLRSSINMSQAFTSLISEWLIVAKKQELYKQPAYCSLPGLQIISDNVLLSFPMQANSIYEQPLNRLIHQTHAAGLVEYWKKVTIRQMIHLGMISQEDPFPYAAFNEFKVTDLTWIWILLGICLFLACLLFLCEIVVHFYMTKRKL